MSILAKKSEPNNLINTEEFEKMEGDKNEGNKS